MWNEPRPQERVSRRAGLDALAENRPDVVLMAPYMVYLVLLGLVGVVPSEWEWAAIVIRGAGSLLVVWLFWKHFPNFGKPLTWIAVPAGLFAAWGWVAGQYFFDDLGYGGRLPGFPGEKVIEDPRDTLGAYRLFWTTSVLRVAVACTAVPVVEELFWRAFLLRAFINWSEFEKVPLGKFTLFSFAGTALLSTVQHPDNWGVSILCWVFFNALFCWTRSIWCLIIVHAVTNLALYTYVLHVGDWSFW